jgi:hypothetical protein
MITGIGGLGHTSFNVRNTLRGSSQAPSYGKEAVMTPVLKEGECHDMGRTRRLALTVGSNTAG